MRSDTGYLFPIKDLLNDSNSPPVCRLVTIQTFLVSFSYYGRFRTTELKREL